MDCIFCKIAQGIIPCLKVYENEQVLVFMDVARDVDGHMLAIPKEHFESILDCDSQILSSLIQAVQTVSRHCVSQCGYDGVNLLNASGKSAGQSVPHLHIHLIPRKTGDGVDAWPAFEGARQPLEQTHQALMIPDEK